MFDSRFLFSTKTNVAGQKVQLKHKGLTLAKADKTKITGQLSRGIACLDAALTATNGTLSAHTKEMAARYFLTSDSGPTGAQLTKIREFLHLTYNGLKSETTFKLGGDGAFGFVVRSAVAAGTEGSIAYPNGKTYSRAGHTIHVSKKRLLTRGDELAVVTFIHEASHKYANTFDHGDQGYRKHDDSGWDEPGLLVDQALVNADSYGYFAYRVGVEAGV